MKLTTLRIKTAATQSALLAALGLMGNTDGASLLQSGHADLGVSYAGGQLHFHVEGDHDHGGGGPEEEEHGEEIFVWINNPVILTTTDPSLLGGLGATTGSTIYLLPQSGAQSLAGGVPHVGFATEELVPSEWSAITIALTGVSGPGNYSVYQPDGSGGFTFSMSSANGIDGSDVLVLNPGVHDHFNIAFTEPGTYEIGFTVSGTHAVDGFKSTTETITFTSIPEPSTAVLGFLAAAMGLGYRRRRAF